LGHLTRFDEVGISEGYSSAELSAYEKYLPLVVNHYVAPRVPADKQRLTYFPNTKPLTPEYQQALELVCTGL